MNGRGFAWALAIALIWLALDQALKHYTLSSVPPYPNGLDVLPGLTLSFARNTGAAWSLLSGANWLLTLVRLVAGVGLLAYTLRKPGHGLVRTVALGLIAGGAFGNALDGLLRGYVVDMLRSHWLSSLYRPFFGTEYPVFNLADVGVVSGVILLVVSKLLEGRGRINAS